LWTSIAQGWGQPHEQPVVGLGAACGTYTNNLTRIRQSSCRPQRLCTAVHLGAARLPSGLSFFQPIDGQGEIRVIHRNALVLTITTTIYVYVNNMTIRIRAVSESASAGGRCAPYPFHVRRRRVHGRSSSAWHLERLARTQRQRARRAAVHVIVDQPHRLHQRIHRGRAYELPAALFQILRQCRRFGTDRHRA